MRIARFKIAAIVLVFVMAMACGSALAWADAGGSRNGVGDAGGFFDQMAAVPLHDQAGNQYEVRLCYTDKPYKQFDNINDEVAYLQGVDKKPVDAKVITSPFPGCSSKELCSTLKIDAGKNYKKGNIIAAEIICPENKEGVPIYFIMKDSTGKISTFESKTSSSQYLITYFYLNDNCDLTISVGHKHEVKTDDSNQSSSSNQTAQPTPTTGKWVKSGSRWWYQYSDGSYPKSCTKTIDGATYRFDSAGWMRTGWIHEDSTWYFHHGSGAMARGWIHSGAWYYLDPSSGAMKTGFYDVNGTRYYSNSSGAMLTGWVQVDGKWYYLTSSGAMQKSKWIGNYWVGNDGVMVTNSWVDNGRYYVGANGAWVPNAKK